MAFKSLDDLEFVDPEGKVLGEGGFSEVKLVRLKLNKKLYALNHVHFANLKKEIKIHQTLWHPHIIRFEGAIQEEHMVYILLEYADNGALFFFINPRTGMPERYAFKFFYQVAQSLEYLHSKGIMHRDIKPENILLDKNYDAKLCDFGWCAEHESICGTYEYMPPEIVNEKPHNKEVDLWALGVLLYELIHGRAPYTAETMEEIKERMKVHEITFKKSLSKEAKDIMLQLLRFDPADRLSLEKLFRHPFILKHIDEFESNRDSFKYIPPEPEWDNDLDIHPPLGLDQTDTQKTFEDDIMSDPIKQHEYIAKKLAEAKINPQDVEKVYFLRDESNNLKMRLQMKDRPQPKRGNSERKITNSFSQRFVPSVKRSDGSPKKYEEGATKFENILKDQQLSSKEYSLGNDAKEASAFLKKFEETNIQNNALVSGHQGLADGGPNLKLKLGKVDLEYNLIRDRQMPEFEPYSQEIMPSELGSPGRSDLAESVSSKKKLEKTNSVPDNQPHPPYEAPLIPMQNPYSIGNGNGPTLAQQSSLQTQQENSGQGGAAQTLTPLTLNSGPKKDKTESPTNAQAYLTAPSYFGQPGSSLQPPNMPEQTKLISIKSSDNLFKYEITPEPFSQQQFGGGPTPPLTSFNRAINPQTFQSHQIYPYSPFSHDGPVNQGSLDFHKHPQPPEVRLNQGGSQPPVFQQPSVPQPSPTTPQAMTHPDFSQQLPWNSGIPQRPPEQASHSSNMYLPTASQQQPPPQTADFKVKEAPQVKKAEPMNPLKSPLNQSLKLNAKDEHRHIQDATLAQNQGVSIPNASNFMAKLQQTANTHTSQNPAHGQIQQTVGQNGTVETRQHFERQESTYYKENLKTELAPSMQTFSKPSDAPQTGGFKPITITGSPFKSEKAVSSPMRQTASRKEEPPVRVPLEDLAKAQNQTATTATPRKADDPKELVPDREERYRKMSGNLEDDKSKSTSGQMLPKYPQSFPRDGAISSGPVLKPAEDNRQVKYEFPDAKLNQIKSEPRTITTLNPPFSENRQQDQAGFKSSNNSPKRLGDKAFGPPQNPLQTSLADYNKNSRNLPFSQPSVEPNKIQPKQSVPEHSLPSGQANFEPSEAKDMKNAQANLDSYFQKDRERANLRSDLGYSKTTGQYGDNSATAKTNSSFTDLSKPPKDYIRDGDRINRVINGNDLTTFSKESPQRKQLGQFFPPEGVVQKGPLANSSSRGTPLGFVAQSDRSTANPVLKPQANFQGSGRQEPSSDGKQAPGEMVTNIYNRPPLQNAGWSGESSKDISGKGQMQYSHKDDADRSYSFKPLTTTFEPQEKITINSRKNSEFLDQASPYLQTSQTKDKLLGDKQKAMALTSPSLYQQSSADNSLIRTSSIQRETSRQPQDLRAITISSNDRSRSQNISRRENVKDFSMQSGAQKTHAGGNLGGHGGLGGLGTSFSKLPEPPSVQTTQNRTSVTAGTALDTGVMSHRPNPLNAKLGESKASATITFHSNLKRVEDFNSIPPAFLGSKKSVQLEDLENLKTNVTLPVQSNHLTALLENQGRISESIKKFSPLPGPSYISKESPVQKEGGSRKGPYMDSYSTSNSENTLIKITSQTSHRTDYALAPTKTSGHSDSNTPGAPGISLSSQIPTGRDSYFGKSDKVAVQFGSQSQGSQPLQTQRPQAPIAQNYTNTSSLRGPLPLKASQDSPSSKVVITSKGGQSSLSQQPSTSPFTYTSALKPHAPTTASTTHASPGLQPALSTPTRPPTSTVIYSKRL